MVAGELLISSEMMTAPEHPLMNGLEPPLLERSESPKSLVEIHEQQKRDRLPGIVKRIIPIDNNTAWEYWWCVPGRLLLPEDIELLQRDRPRVEAILSKLIWLWGAYCHGEQTSRSFSEGAAIHDWQAVLAFVDQQHLKPEIIDIDFLPLAVNNLYGQDTTTTPDYVAVEPAHWHIEFFPLQTVDGYFQLQEPKQLCSCQIWTNKPFLKHLTSGNVLIPEKNLWLSRPLDLTDPPWSSYQTALYS